MSNDSNEKNDSERSISISDGESDYDDVDKDPGYEITNEDKRCEKLDLEEDGVTSKKTKRVNLITLSIFLHT